jgi:hypothetical protein
MEPDDTQPLGVTLDELNTLNISEIKALRVAIDGAINEAGRLADCLSGDDGAQTDGVHGLQMAYDRLTEAKMWCGKSLGELGRKLPEEFRDEAINV